MDSFWEGRTGYAQRDSSAVEVMVVLEPRQAYLAPDGIGLTMATRTERFAAMG